MDLFGEEPADRKPKKKPSSDAAVKRVIDAYHAAFVARFGFKPRIVGGKDGTIVKRLLATWGEPVVLELVGEFFATTNPRVVRSDYTIGALDACAQAMRIGANRIDERTAANIDAVVRASQPRTRRS